MKFITLFAGALVATAAANILLSSDAYADTMPNGWTQMGKGCGTGDGRDQCTNQSGCSDNNRAAPATTEQNQSLFKMSKTNSSGTTVYGVWNATQSKWVGSSKGKTLEYVNNKMNTQCGVKSYSPT
jgi:hypothetical protein